MHLALRQLGIFPPPKFLPRPRQEQVTHRAQDQVTRVVAIIDGGLIKIIDGLSSNRRLLNCCVAA